MSVFWYVDERSRPQRFEANVWLIFVPRPGLWLPPTLASTIRRGLTYWNQRRDQALSASGGRWRSAIACDSDTRWGRR